MKVLAARFGIATAVFLISFWVGIPIGFDRICMILMSVIIAMLVKWEK